MKPEIAELLLMANIVAEKHNTAYTLQTQHIYRPEYRKMFPRTKVLKFTDKKCVQQVYVWNEVDTINYLNDELKLYNNK